MLFVAHCITDYVVLKKKKKKTKCAKAHLMER